MCLFLGGIEFLVLFVKGRLMICRLDLNFETFFFIRVIVVNIGRKIKELFFGIGIVFER